MRTSIALAILLTAATAACAGTRVPLVDGVPCDTARIVPLGDTMHRLVHATLSVADSAGAAAAALPAEYAELVLHSITNGLAIPTHLSGPSADSVLETISIVLDPDASRPHLVFADPPSRLGESYSLATAIAFGLRANGRIEALSVARVSSELALTRALVVAALEADSMRLVAARPAGADTSTIRLRIDLGFDVPAGIVTRPLFRAALPRPFDRRPAPVAGSVRRPNFFPAREPGREWHATTRFVLDLEGRPVPESVETLSATDSSWAEATRRLARRMRYQPAVLGGCPVKVRAIQPWSYVVR
ncbi:MAG TPA: hypothetical protein VFZ11_07480 [Gemmatimonadaceae bacterium]